ncbi:hypothetical protein CAEBREN_23342 [Caenorhabditis brenneri]|uniref:DUF7809 domain-containing protein n=1 Tax=Caenorhabditis brenneri TaxID=135651 RepID=G0MU57_CAEBE|nr:hypothetical protein CAEBREN_23342 [Caenorhabditis brenneri]
MNRFTSVIAPDLTMLSASSQEKLIRKFLPVELIPAGWSCQQGTLIKNIQNLYDKSNKTIQMYGSPENFEKALINFMSFPGNQQFFQFNDSVCYRNYVRVFQSLGGVSYIYKKDIYDLLHEFAPKIDTLAPLQELGHNLLAYYLKIQQNKLTSSHEMIVYNHEFMQSLEKKRLVNEEGMESESWKRHVSESAFYHSKNDDEVLNTITSLFVKCGATLDSDMRDTVTSVMKDLPVKENVLEYTRMVFCLYNTMEGYMELIGKNKLMMLSRCETVDSIPISKIPIRLFESNEEKMVMSHELLHAIKLEELDVSGFEDKILAMPKLSTMNFREVFGTIPSDIFKMLEFVKVPLKTGPRSLVVVSTIDGNHCVSAYQFFIRTISDMILVRKIFQVFLFLSTIELMRIFEILPNFAFRYG